MLPPSAFSVKAPGVETAPSAEVEAKAKKAKRVFMKGILPKRLQQRGTVQRSTRSGSRLD
jgi:hypothetical protein